MTDGPWRGYSANDAIPVLLFHERLFSRKNVYDVVSAPCARASSKS